MALIVEDGTEVANANSYVTDVEFTDYCTARNYTVSGVASEREVLLIKAMDYLHGIEDKFQGVRASSTQSLGFPRRSVVLHGYNLETDKIPDELKNAQMELAYHASNEDILVNETNSNLSGFNVQGVYSETYSKGAQSKVVTGKANAYLKCLLNSTKELARV
jgi:hypothetical protein